MYCKEKPFRNENHEPKKTHKSMPSFSSTLLDEICRSIDGNGESPENFQAYRETPVRGFRAKSSSCSARDDEISRFSRACVVEKWMEKEVNEKIVAKKLENSVLQYNDLLFFSSTSNSSDSSGALSSSETEFFGSSTRPKPVRTGVSPRRNNKCFSFDDYQNYEKNKVEDDLIKSKSRALKIYANLKKLKQPISPGPKLTSLINSFFTTMNRKKSKSKDVDRKKVFHEMSSPDQTASSTCSSASSFSRSCLSKNSSKSSEKTRDGIQRTVRFHPVGVIVDQDSKPCGEKSICDEGYDKYGRPPLPPNALKVNQDQRKYDIHGDEDKDEAFSESSSDLFELDHLSLFGNNDRFCEELPVYETTYFDRNHGLIR